MTRVQEALARLAAWIRARIGKPARLPSRQARGRRAERAAARLLRRSGFRILQRNFTVPSGEIDIIAFRRGVLAFVEVRSLDASSGRDPIETIGCIKRQRIIRAAENYIARRRPDRSPVTVRYDVVSVTLDESGRPQTLRHVENAFTAGGKSFA